MGVILLKTILNTLNQKLIPAEKSKHYLLESILVWMELPYYRTLYSSSHGSIAKLNVHGVKKFHKDL